MKNRHRHIVTTVGMLMLLLVGCGEVATPKVPEVFHTPCAPEHIDSEPTTSVVYAAAPTEKFPTRKILVWECGNSEQKLSSPATLTALLAQNATRPELGMRYPLGVGAFGKPWALVADLFPSDRDNVTIDTDETVLNQEGLTINLRREVALGTRLVINQGSPRVEELK